MLITKHRSIILVLSMQLNTKFSIPFMSKKILLHNIFSTYLNEVYTEEVAEKLGLNLSTALEYEQENFRKNRHKMPGATVSLLHGFHRNFKTNIATTALFAAYHRH